MRILLILTCLANVAFAFGSLSWMPNPMANHFDLDGTPNGFMSPAKSALVMSIFCVLGGGICLGISLLTPIIPTECINMPNRDHWLNEENRPKTIRRIRSYTELIGIGTMLFFLLLQWEVFQANQTVPPKLLGSNAWFGYGVLLVVLTIETVRFYFTFRLPKEKSQL